MLPTRHTAAARPARGRQVKTATKNPERVRARRDALVNAAIKVFLEKGYHEATVRDIGRAAGMTQGTIYNYVRSKDDILYLVCNRIVAEYQQETTEALKATDDPVARVRSAISALCQVIHRRRREVRLIYQESHALDERSLRAIKARVEEFIGLMEDIVTAAGRQARIAYRSPHFTANVLTFLPLIVVLRRWSFRGDLGEQQVLDEIADFLMRGLGFTQGGSRK